MGGLKGLCYTFHNKNLPHTQIAFSRSFLPTRANFLSSSKQIMSSDNDAPLFDDPILQTSFTILKFIFAMSPLILLGLTIYSGISDPEEEELRRKKKTDFQLAGHDS